MYHSINVRIMKKIFLCLLLLATGSVYAQTMSSEEQAAAIERLTREVEQLKAESQTHTKWDKVVAAMPKISGYVMGRYTYNGDESTFRLRRVRLSVAGDIGKKIDYKFQAELSSFKLLDAYFNYKPFEQFKVKVGQFKVPFSIENTEYSPTKIILIDHPMGMQRLMGFDEKIGETTLKNTGRELGINLHGSVLNKALSYDLAVFNGAGLNTTDNNKSKDVVGRLIYSPIQGLRVSGSYYWGEFGEEFYARERWTVGAAYDKGALIARAEYIAGTTGFEDAEIDSEGWYALAGWRFCDGKWSVAARYDTFSENTEVSALDQTNYTVGVAWKPIKNFRMQLNYQHEDRGSKGHRNCVMVQATASF
ncbi:MAG: porin [Rikenellaceae bacterium]|nr:porin [Rikenellaceae bacterium]